MLAAQSRRQTTAAIVMRRGDGRQWRRVKHRHVRDPKRAVAVRQKLRLALCNCRNIQRLLDGRCSTVIEQTATTWCRRWRGRRWTLLLAHLTTGGGRGAAWWHVL